MSPRFIFGFGLVTTLLVLANVGSYLSGRRAYYDFLEQSGWVWAGHWTWGFPFTLVIAGLGSDNHSQLAPFGLVLNVLVWFVAAGLAGIGCEVIAERFKNKIE